MMKVYHGMMTFCVGQVCPFVPFLCAVCDAGGDDLPGHHPFHQQHLVRSAGADCRRGACVFRQKPVYRGGFVLCGGVCQRAVPDLIRIAFLRALSDGKRLFLCLCEKNDVTNDIYLTMRHYCDKINKSSSSLS